MTVQTYLSSALVGHQRRRDLDLKPELPHVRGTAVRAVVAEVPATADRYDLVSRPQG